jgi:hypothetical protein
LFVNGSESAHSELAAARGVAEPVQALSVFLYGEFGYPLEVGDIRTGERRKFNGDLCAHSKAQVRSARDGRRLQWIKIQRRRCRGKWIIIHRDQHQLFRNGEPQPRNPNAIPLALRPQAVEDGWSSALPNDADGVVQNLTAAQPFG